MPSSPSHTSRRSADSLTNCRFSSYPTGMDVSPKVIRIRRRLVVYFDKALRSEFDKIAYSSGLRGKGDPPCDAELARVLLVAQLFAGSPVAVAVAAALRSNAVVSLGRRLSRLGHDLVPSLVGLVEQLAGGLPPKEPRLHRAPGGDQGGRPRVCLVLDEWTHARLVAYAMARPQAYSGVSIRTESGVTRKCAPDMALVRAFLEAALRQPERPTDVATRYAKVIQRIETALDRAISSERDSIADAIAQARIK